MELLLGNAGQLRLVVTANRGAPLTDHLLLRLVHPTRSGADQRVSLQRDGNYYVGRLTAAPVGRLWHVSVEDETHAWRVTGDWEPQRQPVLQLPGPAKK
jgi:hypothetical protein